MATTQEAIRRLSIQATTTGVDDATSKLQKLAQAQGGVAVASTNTERATLSLDQKFASIERRYVASVRAQQDYEKTQRQVNAAVAQNPALQDRANVILAEAKRRHDDIANGLDKSTSAVDRLGAMLTRRLIGAVVLSQLKNVVSTVVNLNTELAKTGDIASRTGVGGQNIQGLQAAAGYKGIDQSAFLDTMVKFNDEVDQAKVGLGGLSALFRVNGVAAKDTEDAFLKVADLVKNSATEAGKFSILQQAGLPATREYVKLMEQGADAIKTQADAAKKFSDNQLEQARKLEERWNEMWVNFTRWGKQAALDVGEGIKNIPTPLAHQGTWIGAKLQGMGFDRPEDPNSQLNQARDRIRNGIGASLTAQGADSFYNAVQGKPANSNTIDPERQKALMGLETQRISILGQTASAQDQVRAKEIEINNARIAGVSITKDQETNLKRLAQENALGITQIKATTDSYRTEMEVIGMSTGAAASYRAVQEQINQAKRDGRTLTQDNINAITREAETLGRAASQTENLRFAYDNLQSLTQSFGQNLRQGQGAWEAFKNSGLDALGRIADRLAKMATDQLWTAAFGGSSGIGGLLGGIFGGGANPVVEGATMSSGLGASFPMFASGTDSAPGGWSIVGEKGPELMNVPKGAQILPNGKMPSNDNGNTTISIVNHNDFRGVDPSSQAFVVSQVRQSEARIIQAVPAIVAKHRANTPGSNR